MFFRPKKFSGIDFHENYITCATVKLERGMPVVHDISKIDVDASIITGGRVNQFEDLAILLEDSVRSGSLSKDVHLAIPTQNTLIRKITTLPDIGEAELGKILQFEIGESIHLPFENPIYDFVKIGSIIPNRIDVRHDIDEEELSLDDLAQGIQKNMEGPKSEVLLFATSQSLSQDLADVCMEAGLKPLTAEIRGLALQRLLSYAHPLWLSETEMIIDVSGNSFDIHIFKDHMIVFSRMMSINTSDFLSNLVTPGRSYNDDVLLFEEDLPAFKETQGEIAATIDEVTHRNQNDFVNQIALEIEKAQNFFRYSLNERDSEFKRIIVTGESTDKMLRTLKERMGTEEVVRIDYRSILDHNFSNENLLDSCSVAIGLAMRANDIK